MRATRLLLVLLLAVAVVCAAAPTFAGDDDKKGGLLSRVMRGKVESPRQETKEQPRESRPAPTVSTPAPAPSPAPRVSNHDSSSQRTGLFQRSTPRTDTRPAPSAPVVRAPEAPRAPVVSQPPVARPAETPRPSERGSILGNVLNGRTRDAGNNERTPTTQPRIEQPQVHERPEPIRAREPSNTTQPRIERPVVRDRTEPVHPRVPSDQRIRQPETRTPEVQRPSNTTPGDSDRRPAVIHPRRDSSEPVWQRPEVRSNDRPEAPILRNNSRSPLESVLKPDNDRDTRDGRPGNRPGNDDRKTSDLRNPERRPQFHNPPSDWRERQSDTQRKRAINEAVRNDGKGLIGAVLGAQQKDDFQRRLRNLESRQPHQIKVPDNVYMYRSPRPGMNHDRWSDLWDRSRHESNRKRWLWNNWTRSCPPVRVVYQPRYFRTPVYQYWPSSWGSYYYWGWDDIRDNDLNVVVVYAPPSSTTYRYDTSRDYTYVANGSDRDGLQWPEYDQDKADAERAAREIERAWEKSDISLMDDYVEADVPVRYYESGEYLYWMSDTEFLDMVDGDMRDRGTRAFSIEAVFPVRPGEVHVYTKHDLERSGRSSNTQYERYALERIGSRWVISAYELSLTKMISR